MMKMVYHICKALWELKKSTGKLKVVFANWNSIFFLSEILTCLYCLPLFNWCHLFLLDCNGSSWLKRPDRSYWNMKLSKLQRLAFLGMWCSRKSPGEGDWRSNLKLSSAILPAITDFANHWLFGPWFVYSDTSITTIK